MVGSDSSLVTDAVDSGDERGLLEAMLRRCAEKLDDPKTPANAFAALMRRAHEIQREIQALDAADDEDGDGAANTPDEPFDAEEI